MTRSAPTPQAPSRTDGDTMGILAARVPLALLMDLALPFDSSLIYSVEGADVDDLAVFAAA